MAFNDGKGIVFVPDGTEEDVAFRRTTHLGIGAHHDDLEIMAVDGILRCFDKESAWFCGVIVTDGKGSPRSGPYKNYTDDEMAAVRLKEQKEAASLGRYTAQVLLGYGSEAVKDGSLTPADDLEAVLRAAEPHTVYTHNLMDRHDAHVGTALNVIEALRRLGPSQRPSKVYGCEVWRDLDWLVEGDRVVFDCSEDEELQEQLLRVFRSQIAGGKRYDTAAMGRRRAHATYGAAHEVDAVTGAVYAVDMTLLMDKDGPTAEEFVSAHLGRFEEDVRSRLARLCQ